jgi:glutamate N-acetyltransferase/amino-acid N-acetyltransferase
LLASGASGKSLETSALASLVHQACDDLSTQLVADAEGATKQILVRVEQAATEDDAIEVARAIARSSLLKCAVHGADPNWGRVLAAAGTTVAAFDPNDIDVAFNGVPVCRGGAIGVDRSEVDLSGTDVTITVDLHAGTATGFIRTTDLTAAYVHENSAYSS